MAEKITRVYEDVRDQDALDHFSRYGHIALANVYDPSLGDDAASSVYRRVRLHSNNRLSGQTGDVRYMPSNISDSLTRIISAAINHVDTLNNPDVDLPSDKVHAQVIDHAPGAQGNWHKDLGIIVTTLQGSSLLEIDGEGQQPDATYELVPGRIVVMNPTRRLLHRGVAGRNTSRTGLAIERMR